MRAKETAEIAAKVLGKGSKLAYDDCLLGDTEVKAVYKRLRKLDSQSSVLLVSHQPLINTLIADLLGGDSNFGIFSGAIACVQCKAFPGRAKGMLVWLFPPKMFFDGARWPI